MAGRVNVKFVVILTLAMLVVAGGVIYLATQVILKSAEDHARLAQQAQDEGDWTRAQTFWGKAVSEDRTSPEYLAAYIVAVQNKPVDTEIEYREQFQKYQAGLRQMAEIKRTDLEAHQTFFDELFLLIAANSANTDLYQNVIIEVDRIEGLLFNETDSDLFKQIRRYRGIATSRLAQLAPDTSIETMEKGLEDLAAAMEVRPGDVSLAVAEVDLYNAIANEKRVSGSRNEAREAYKNGIEAARAFVEQNPDNVAGRFLLVQSEIAQSLRDLENRDITERDLFGPELTRARRETAASYSERVESLASDAVQSGIEDPSVSIMSRLTYVMALVSPQNYEENLAEIWQRVVESNPDDRRLRLAYGRFLTQLNRHEDAIEIFQPISELVPGNPITTEGFLRYADRNLALYQMANAALELARQAQQDGESGDAWTARARSYRDELAQNIPTDQPMMQFVDARLALASGDLMKADRLFRSFNEATSRSNAEGLRLASEVANRMNNRGLERDLLTMAVELEPNDVESLVRLASVEIGLREYESALRVLREAQDLRPDLEVIQEQIDIVEALVGGETDDPVIRVLAQAQLANDSGSIDRAEEIVRTGLEENPDDVRLVIAMATYLRERNAWDEADEMIERGLALDPENTQLRRIRREVQLATDPEAFKRDLEESNLTDLEKQIRLYQLYLMSEEPESAAAALDAAEQIDPTDNRVIVFRFDEAIRAGDVERARAIYEANKDKDVDGAEGLAMRARVELAEGEMDSARRTLQSAVERGASNAMTLKLLADVLLEMGDTFNALERYREAIAIRPDVDILKGYIAVLSRLGRDGEALQVARLHLTRGERDTQFREMWLNLEGSAGNKDLAYQRRLEIADAEPDNARNEVMLISLMLDLRKFDEARTRLDEARAREDSLSLASLDARWHADRNELAEAAQVYSDYIASDANALSDPSAYLAFGTFLIERGQTEQGLRTIRQATLLQDSDSPIADAVLADQLIRLNRHEEAIPVLQKLIDAGFQADTAEVQIIESYIRLNQPEEAQAAIEALDEEDRSSLSVLLMRSDIAQLQGNESEASQLVDRAIAEYPEDPLPYMKRAARLMRDERTLPDAAEDLTRAIELNPYNSNAYRLRSLVYNETGQTQKAAADIVASANADAGNLPLLVGAVEKLLDMGRSEQAANLVEQAIERRPTDLSLMISAGDAFARGGEHRLAVTYYERAWEQTKSMGVARRLVASLLDQSSPDLSRARQVAGDPAIADENNPGNYILRALIDDEEGNVQAMRRNMVLAYEIIKNEPARFNAWLTSLRSMLDEREDLIAFLAAIDTERGLAPWPALFYAQILVEEDDTRERGMQTLSALVSDADPALRLAAYKVRSMAKYRAGDYEDAGTDMSTGLDLAPDDADLLNNYAYLLVSHLNRAEEALPLAQKAVSVAPTLRAAHDTLGVVYLENNQPAEAVRALETALSLASTEADRAPVLVHLAKARHASGNVGGAQEAAQEARRIIVDKDELFDDELKEELDEVLELTRNQ